MHTRVKTPSTNRLARGFTLVELMCAAALLAIVVTFALPGFATLIQKFRMRQAVMELKGALYIARSEAVRRAEYIKLRKRDSMDGRSCTGAANDWSCGWMVFLDGNGNSIYDENASSGDELLRVFPGPINTSVRFTSNASFLVVNRWGAINGVAASFAISTLSANNMQSSDSSLDMIVCVSSGGRVRTAQGSSCS